MNQEPKMSLVLIYIHKIIALERLLKKIADEDQAVFRKDISTTEYCIKNCSEAYNKKNSRISCDYVDVEFVDRKQWSHSDRCEQIEIADQNIQKLTAVLNAYWGSVVNDIEKETKNREVMRSLQYIMDTITNKKVQVAANCTMTGIKRSVKARTKANVFPDIMWSYNGIMYGTEPKDPFIVVDYKIPGKLEAFNYSKNELQDTWTMGCNEIKRKNRTKNS
ncbi:hypothetical protein RFI_30495 [Reticulomyxa filosa]|uniref:Uncharacterized protein n=1 Tax=Reticulomyxa filosa TaxID=46433 RepID=X6M001_RETFI|nr:hypothetical protein RFI_30495 [Reticulomyxa filosa]|eukprot:ETO06896.1 hypothetical protein RFI_30495 [Reticulomyxa filosa]